MGINDKLELNLTDIVNLIFLNRLHVCSLNLFVVDVMLSFVVIVVLALHLHHLEYSYQPQHFGPCHLLIE